MIRYALVSLLILAFSVVAEDFSVTLKREYRFEYKSGTGVRPAELDVSQDKAIVAGGYYTQFIDMEQGTAGKPESIKSRRVAFSLDGEKIAIAHHGVLQVYNVAQGAVVQEEKISKSSIERVAFSSTGYIAASTRDVVALYNTAEGKLEKIKTNSKTSGVSFSPDGKLLAYSDSNGGVTFYEMGTKETFSLKDNFLRKHAMSPRARVSHIAFSNNGNTVAFAYEDSPIISLWDLANRQFLRKLTGHVGILTALQFHPSNDFLLSSSDKTYGKESKLFVWEVGTGKRASFPELHHSIYGARFSKDGERIITTTRKTFDIYSFQMSGQMSNETKLAELEKQEKQLQTQLDEVKKEIDELKKAMNK